MKAPQAAALPQTWSTPCRHLLTYFCRLLTHHWHIRVRAGAHGHKIKYLLRTPPISLCCQMQRLFFIYFFFIFLFTQVPQHRAGVCCTQNADAYSGGRHFKLGTAEHRLQANVLSDAFAAQQAELRKNASLTAHSTDGKLLKLKNVLNCWKRCAVHGGRQPRWHILAACTKKSGSSWKYHSESFSQVD